MTATEMRKRRIGLVIVITAVVALAGLAHLAGVIEALMHPWPGA